MSLFLFIGCGKSMIVEAVAEKFDYDLIPVLAGDIKDMYLGVCKFSL